LVLPVLIKSIVNSPDRWPVKVNQDSTECYQLTGDGATRFYSTFG